VAERDRRAPLPIVDPPRCEHRNAPRALGSGLCRECEDRELLAALARSGKALLRLERDA
jgi:hypothetical protein